jgi:hypothetical protein
MKVRQTDIAIQIAQSNWQAQVGMSDLPLDQDSLLWDWFLVLQIGADKAIL